jgi:hypothetical protein
MVDAIARADYDEPVGRERPEAPPQGTSLPREGGVFRRFVDGFRYDSELGSRRQIHKGLHHPGDATATPGCVA